MKAWTPRLSFSTRLMREVTKKDSKFSWNKDLEEDFQNGKRMVSSVDMPAPYNPGREVIKKPFSWFSLFLCS